LGKSAWVFAGKTRVMSMLVSNCWICWPPNLSQRYPASL
jgi:hypothetical protein